MHERLPANMVRRGSVLYLRMQIRGRDVWRSLRTGSVKEAKTRAATMSSRLIDKHHFGLEDKRVTLGEWWELYQESHLAHVGAYRQKRVRGIMQRLLDEIGPHWNLRDFRQTHASKHLAKRRKAGLADSTVWLERMTIAGVFEAAVKDGHLQQNPWRVKVGKTPAPRIRLVTPAHELAAAQHGDPSFRRWWVFVMETGLRLEESLTLDPSRLDEHDIRIVGKGGYERFVPLSPAARVAFDTQRADGGLWSGTPRATHYAVAKLCEEHSLPHVSPHDLRHTFATRKALAGMSIYKLSAMLGHTSIKTTEKYYIHIKREDVRRALMESVEPKS